jgi:thioredoxin 1
MINLTLENFDKEVLSSQRPCIISVKSNQCYLCVELAPIMQVLQKKYATNFKFGIVETTEQLALTDILKISGVPTIFLFENGDGYEIVYPEDGYSEEQLTDCLDTYLINGG